MAGVAANMIGRRSRSPGFRLAIVAFVGLVLIIPLLFVYELNTDRTHRAAEARQSIAEGWGGEQTLTGPLLAIPYEQTVERVSDQGVKSTTVETHQLVISPANTRTAVTLRPQLRRRSIYTAVLYHADVSAAGTFDLRELDASGVERKLLQLGNATLLYGVSMPRGLSGSAPVVSANGRALVLTPGAEGGMPGQAGFNGALAAADFSGASLPFNVHFTMRGSGQVSLNPTGRTTEWRVASSWPDPSFVGGFLPDDRHVGAEGFIAAWRVGNLALNAPLVATDAAKFDAASALTVALINPVDLYDRVDRAVKYGFLFIGFTFLTLLMFDLVGGTRVPAIAYLLVGIGLVLFFVLLLALAEVIGFTPAYVLASAAVIGLITIYTASLLASWRRAGFIGALLVMLYGVLYVLLGLEAYGLLIGSLLLFVALAVVMALSRRIDWDGGVHPVPLSGAGTA